MYSQKNFFYIFISFKFAFFNFQLETKYLLWEQLTSTILQLKKVGTSPKKINVCLEGLRSAEKLARNNLYSTLGNFNLDFCLKFGVLKNGQFSILYLTPSITFVSKVVILVKSRITVVVYNLGVLKMANLVAFSIWHQLLKLNLYSETKCLNINTVTKSLPILLYLCLKFRNILKFQTKPDNSTTLKSDFCLENLCI